MAITPYRILIADDRPEVCSGLRLLLENEEGNFSVVGEARTLEDLTSYIVQHRADLVILDWELPGLGKGDRLAADTILSFHKSGLPLAIIAFSACFEARKQAQAAGVDGFVSKNEPPEQLLAVLKTVLRQGQA